MASGKQVSSNTAKKLAAHQDWATDNEGNRRFHGAFTGGFSAGYFNTTGSKEGWAPKTFSSSRQNRQSIQHKPEDYMDEDDDPLLGKKLSKRDEYDTLGAEQGEKLRTQAESAATGSSIPGPVPDELFIRPNFSIGTKLLRQMGWREGQGIGPRVPQPELGDEISFAPKNLVVSDWADSVKTDSFGLGYDPLASAPEFRRRKEQMLSLVAANTNAKVSRERQIVRMSDALLGSAGGGSSAATKQRLMLDSASSAYDDEGDVYHADSMENYDLQIEAEQSDTKKKPLLLEFGPEVPTYQPPILKERLALTDQADDSIERCSDGRRPLPGFTLAKSRSFLPRRIPHLEVPENFQPIHRFSGPLELPAYITQRQGQSAQPTPGSDRAGNHESLTAEKRAVLLGEKKASLPENTTKSSNGIAPAPPSKPLAAAPLAASLAETADSLRAMSSAIASRFTSAGSISEQKDKGSDTNQQMATVAEPSAKPAPKRTETHWAPERLLCKRFNVPPPAITKAATMAAAKKGADGTTSIADEPRESALYVKNIQAYLPEVPKTEKITLSQGLSQANEKTSASVSTDTLQNRPPIDIFRAIFDDSESEQEEEEDETATPVSPLRSPGKDIEARSTKESSQSERRFENAVRTERRSRWGEGDDKHRVLPKHEGQQSTRDRLPKDEKLVAYKYSNKETKDTAPPASHKESSALISSLEAMVSLEREKSSRKHEKDRKQGKQSKKSHRRSSRSSSRDNQRDSREDSNDSTSRNSASNRGYRKDSGRERSRRSSRSKSRDRDRERHSHRRSSHSSHSSSRR